MVYTIIVTYNGEAWIRKCLNSLMTSTVKTEIIIVDNNSSDNTLNIIADEFPSVKVIPKQLNLGFGRANNIGIELALNQNPEYLFLLNQDVWIEPDTIKKLIEASYKNDKSLILSPLHLNGAGNELDYNFAYHLEKMFNHKVNLKNSCLGHCPFSVEFVNAAVWLIKCKYLKSVGYFDPIFPHYGEDNDFANRVKFHGYTIDVEPNAIAYHDRRQNFDYDGLKLSKKLNKRQIPYLIILMNINKPYLKCIRQAAGLFAGEIIKHIKAAKLLNVVVELTSFLIVSVLNFRKVIISRKIHKVASL